MLYCLIGYLRAPAAAWERAILLAGACLLIFPGTVSGLIGTACFAAVLFAQRGRVPASGAAAAPRT